MSTEKKEQRSWLRRHPILSFFAFIFVTVTVINAMTSLDQAQERAQASLEPIPEAINVNEYINQPASYFIEKLGNPIEGEYYAELPTSTNWSWEKDGYDVYISFEQGSNVKFVDVQFQDNQCDQKTDRYLSAIGLSYPDREPDVKQDGILYRWEPYTDKYQRLNIYCNEYGTRATLTAK